MPNSLTIHVPMICLAGFEPAFFCAWQMEGNINKTTKMDKVVIEKVLFINILF
jgi:hypothetical protein